MYNRTICKGFLFWFGFDFHYEGHCFLFPAKIYSKSKFSSFKAWHDSMQQVCYNQKYILAFVILAYMKLF